MEVEKKKKKPRKRVKERHWIPPPALTSNLDKERAGKSNPKPVRTDESDSSSCDPTKHSEFETKLKELLHEIHQLKSYVSGEQKEHELLEQKDKIIKSTQAIEELEKTIEKAIEELRLLQKDDSQYRRSFTAMKEELHKNLEENERLTEQQKTLIEKMNRVEKSATEAVEQVIVLRNFIKKLNKLNDSCGSFSQQSGQKYTQEILSKIQELNRANQYLQTIISDTPHNGSDNREIEENAKGTTFKSALDDSDITKLTGKVKDLQANIEKDRKQIVQLQATVHTVRKSSLKDKEELKKAAEQHKERASKYLSVVDDLNLQLSKMRNELCASKQEMGSLKLQIMCLTSERDRLEIEKTTLMGKCSTLESQAVSRSLAITSQSEEISSKFVQFSSKIGILEVENEKLKAQLDDSKREIDRCKADLRRQQEELRAQQMDNSRNAGRTDTKKVDKSAQISLGESPESSTSKVRGPDVALKNSHLSEGQEHWIQMTELWKELQSDKMNILQVLKDLERKLEKSQDVNSEFRRELSKKEDIMQEINSRLQEKIEENRSLKHMLESAIDEAKQISERAKETSLSLDQITQLKLAELEKQVHEYKIENSQLRKSKSEVEKNLSLQIKELQERLDLVEKSRKALHEYIAFLKSSYASVFGDASLATKNYAL